MGTDGLRGLVVTVSPEARAFARGAEEGTFVLRVAAPRSTTARGPARVVVALDVSGSMGGAPLAGAKACLARIAEALAPGDELACVAFASDVRVLVPPTRVDASFRAVLRERLRRLEAGGGTNLLGGALLALALAERGRVVLIPDGAPTVGVTSPGEIVGAVAKGRGRATLSAFGFGEGVHARLVAELAEAGRGHATLVVEGEPPNDAIVREVGDGVATVADRIDVRLEARGGRIRAVHRAGSAPRDDGPGVVVALPSLVAGETVAIPFTVAFGRDADGGPPSVRVDVTARDGAASVVHETRAVVRFEDERGPWDEDAVVAIVEGRAARALHRASGGSVGGSSRSRAAREARVEIARLEALAALAGVGDDPRVRLALDALGGAGDVLESAMSAPRAALEIEAATSKVRSRRVDR